MPGAVPSDEDHLSDRLGSLFSSVAAPRTVEPPPTASTPPPPSPPPPAHAATSMAVASGPSPASSEAIAGLLAEIQGLHTHLERVEEQVNLVGQLGEHLERRLDELGQGLFAWFEEFATWQHDRFQQLVDLQATPEHLRRA